MAFDNTISTGVTGVNAAGASANQETVLLNSENVFPYTPIGIGKPLSIEILMIYTGNFKTRGLFKSKRHDILCVSGVKTAETYDATHRAINFLQQDIADYSFFGFSAFASGTPYIYYKNAVDTDEIEVSVELTASSFSDSLVGSIVSLMGRAGPLPLFMPVAGKLFAGSQLVTLVEDGISELFKPVTFLSKTIIIRFDTAGMPVNKAQSMVVCRDEDVPELNSYELKAVSFSGNTQMRLVNSAGVYKGNAPYIVLNIDGACKPALQSWTPALASSSMLSEFYSNNTISDAAGQTLQQAMGLYNDYSYFQKAQALAGQVTGIPHDDPKYEMLRSQYQSYVNNIRHTAFLAQLPSVTL